MSASKQTAFDYIDEKSGVITDVSDKIWDYAELSLREYKSGELYAKVLKEEGFTVEHPFDNIETAFRASYGSGKPVIGILAEYDALTGLSQIAGSETRKELVTDGNGHGCGHNLLGAGAMAAAFAIKKYLEENLIRPNDESCKDVKGEVVLSFFVDKEGRPQNITVVHGLCESADKEAIRLVKEGPKWTSGDLPTRVTVEF